MEECKNCGKTFQKTSNGHKFCTKECRKIYIRKGNITRDCKYCKKPFIALSNNKYYCSEECLKEYRKEYQKKYRTEEDKLKRTEYNIEYNAKNKEEIKRKRDIYRQSDEFFVNKWKKYGIKDMTAEKYHKIYNEQNGCCAICGRHESEFNKRLALDHNHDTGEVRGLLCHSCNVALGLLQDNLDIVASAASYLQQDYSKV